MIISLVFVINIDGWRGPEELVGAVAKQSPSNRDHHHGEARREDSLLDLLRSPKSLSFDGSSESRHLLWKVCVV